VRKENGSKSKLQTLKADRIVAAAHKDTLFIVKYQPLNDSSF